MYRIITGIVVVIILALGLFFFYRPAGEDGSKIALSTSLTATTTQNGVTGTGNFTVSNTPTIDVPDFRAPIKFSADVATDVRAALNNDLQILSGRLSKDSLDLMSWIQLGGIRKMGGDYKGAESAWVFVSHASPRNSIAYGNLADLYTNFFKVGTSAAEDILKKGIKAIPDSVELQATLARYYKQVGRTSDAKAEFEVAIATATRLGQTYVATQLKNESSK